MAVISVRERSASEIGSGNGISYAVTASRDGVITSCTATRGNLLCSPGQAVKAGQLLISGYIDSGRMIRLTGAEGEIYAQTIHPLTIIMPSVWCSAVRNGETKEKISLILGKKRINLWKDSGIWDTTCGRIYSENYITLPGGFRLPVGLAVDTCLQASIASNQLTQQELENCLGTMAEQYLKNQMIAGQILSRTQLFEAQADACVLAGEYVCTEMIGRVQREQIGD